MKKYSFPRGGFLYDDPAAPAKTDAVIAFLPAISIIPLGNYPSGRVYPLVSIGDMVKEGMLIGRASGAGAVNVHAPVPGRVIRKVSWKDGEGSDCDALVIRMEGAFEKLGKKEDIFPWNGLNSYDLQRLISDFGIIEMEKSGRPLADLISEYRRENEKLTLVVSCVFDDPWLAADYALCQERYKAVAEGSLIAAHACSKVSRIIFAVSHHEKKLGGQLLAETGNWKIPSSLVLTGSRYPQRNNRELNLALRSYEKKEGLDLGSFLILGPAVLAAVHDAVKFKKPILDRYVAVGGSALKRPQVLKVRIGTRIGELFEQCGGFIEKPSRIVMGSPLLGRRVKYLDEPVVKNCYAVAAMSKSQTSFHSRQNCINCGECRAVCPVGLDPQNIYKQITMMDIDKTGTTGCHGCGCCKIVCPSSLPLSDVILYENPEAAYA
ncbi:MAG: SLBB domain-containing protein [Treponema sp.]|jgi:electron transport complex protein RnfC|nr:SLBB domain-containing protein [Treponema sp.]